LPPSPVPSHARQHAQAPRLPYYRFRANDRAHLQRYYQAPLRTVRPDRRPHFRAGYVVPPAFRPHIAVVPLHARRHLPPPPRGYQVGYYEGYSVVYDPLTFTILSVLDLLSH
jgi:Ni/Co efflux regulator RcnB